MSTVFHLISVGESSWTRFARLEGMRDISLSEKGRAQVTALIPQLATLPLTKMYFARTTRGYQTVKLLHDELSKGQLEMQELRRAQRVKAGLSRQGFERGSYFSLAKRNAYAQIKLYRDHRLNDIDYGVLSGLYPEEIEYRHTELWERFQTDPMETTFPSGEAMKRVWERVIDFVQSCRTHELFDIDIAVVTHIPIVQLITCYCTEQPPETFREIECSDGSISVVQYR